MTYSRLRHLYDNWSEAYASDFSDELDRKPADRAALAAFARSLPPGQVLDVGAGPGHIGAELRGHGLDVILTDLSPAMLRAGRQALPVVASDFHHLPFADASFSGIVAFYTLIHAEPAKLPDALVELRRVLKPAGRMLATFHCGDGIVYKDGVAFHFARPGPLIKHARRAGFSSATVTERPSYPEEGGDWTRLMLSLES